MRIAIASGKGGTGKSMVASNMALALARSGIVVTLADCDVEAPNLHLFLPCGEMSVEDVTVPVPIIDRSRCTFCGKCAAFCKYNAISIFPGSALVFPELCHSCGGCAIACPENAISEILRKVGTIRTCEYPSGSGSVRLISGELGDGEHSSVPVIKAVHKTLEGASTAIVDSPPGTSCGMVASVHGADYCILVTEPTPFGMHDLCLAVLTLRKLNMPHGVVINKSFGDDRLIEDYCHLESIPVFGKIPYDKEIARHYSEGIPALERMPELSDTFMSIYEKAKRGDIR